ncbi:MAG TPA: hopanoid biosynthesis-associated protein HpnK [Stellaceae bacterium]|nr:hopanoid biosynthesis-associated protein HpnK [Stellaceae bacterium]
MKSLIVCADDFGLDLTVNEAVEQAHRHGILTSASLMIAAPAAADAVARARRMPELRVGLHLVLVDGIPLLPPEQIGSLVRCDGRFDRNMVRAAIRFAVLPQARRQLALEIATQFAAFRATGLRLDHVNAHKHLHVHPTVARLTIEIGRDFGMKAVRVPSEPIAVLRAACPGERYRAPLYRPWIAQLRRRLQAAGLFVNDHLFGLAWTGSMREEKLLGLLAHLPDGISEIYCHPAIRRGEDELAALLSPRVKNLISMLGIRPIGYSDLLSLRNEM